ncbi:hypothetical protein DFH06DRAFT_529672 [Mycena polygramma]|nr:hypothetical protein DFH06DRAFT_529672 [Mycena polygramma]
MWLHHLFDQLDNLKANHRRLGTFPSSRETLNWCNSVPLRVIGSSDHHLPLLLGRIANEKANSSSGESLPEQLQPRSASQNYMYLGHYVVFGTFHSHHHHDLARKFQRKLLEGACLLVSHCFRRRLSVTQEIAGPPEICGRIWKNAAAKERAAPSTPRSASLKQFRPRGKRESRAKHQLVDVGRQRPEKHRTNTLGHFQLPRILNTCHGYDT